jgi:MinD-like ATPase involved in chromosome partitioning or flagellar assembly
VGISDDDVLRIVGRRPDIRVPSDIDITRSVNDGRPIVISKPKSEAAQSFHRLAEAFMARAERLMPDATNNGHPGPKAARRHLFARRH